jgi:hypothetical protein
MVLSAERLLHRAHEATTEASSQHQLQAGRFDA